MNAYRTTFVHELLTNGKAITVNHPVVLAIFQNYKTNEILKKNRCVGKLHWYNRDKDNLLKNCKWINGPELTQIDELHRQINDSGRSGARVLLF